MLKHNLGSQELKKILYNTIFVICTDNFYLFIFLACGRYGSCINIDTYS